MPSPAIRGPSKPRSTPSGGCRNRDIRVAAMIPVLAANVTELASLASFIRRLDAEFTYDFRLCEPLQKDEPTAIPSTC